MSKRLRREGHREIGIGWTSSCVPCGLEYDVEKRNRGPEDRIPNSPTAAGMRRRTLIVDNYDSYTHNLFQLVYRVTGDEPLVIRNDDWATYDKLKNDQMLFNIILSPGPGRPDRHQDFGVCRRILQEAPVPVLGVCLGFQGLGLVYGMEVSSVPMRNVPFHFPASLSRLSIACAAVSHQQSGPPRICDLRARHACCFSF
jgi:hypothetical protein